MCRLFPYMLLGFYVLCCTHEISPLAPERLAGEYDLKSFTDKRSNIFYESGIPTKNGEGVLTSFSGALVLTETEFEISRIITFYTNSGDAPQTYEESVKGDYFIDNSLFVVRESKTGRADVIPISISGNLLILEDSDFKFVYQRS